MVMKCCPWVMCGSICGGEKRKSEKGRLRKGVNVLVATPGQALDHLLKTEAFCVGNLEWVVIDEADRLFDMGFEKQVSAIVDQLNAKKKAGPEVRATEYRSCLCNHHLESAGAGVHVLRTCTKPRRPPILPEKHDYYCTQRALQSTRNAT